MKIAIVGSRGFTDYEMLSSFILSSVSLNDITAVVSGGAAGADSLGERFAEQHGISKIIHRPDWKRHGKAAGFIRNDDIIRDADVVFVFWDGISRGTSDSIRKSYKYNKKIFIKRYDIV